MLLHLLLMVNLIPHHHGQNLLLLILLPPTFTFYQLFKRFRHNSQTYLSPYSPPEWCCGKETQTCSGTWSHFIKSSFPTSLLLGLCFLIAVYLIKRHPTSALHFQVPYNVLFKQSPYYKFLKVFGCACFPLLGPYNAHKLDYRSQECLFLGYSLFHKGYRCLSPSSRLYISKDVLFHLTQFPYDTLFSKSSSEAQSFNTNSHISLPPLPNFMPTPSLSLVVSPSPHLSGFVATPQPSFDHDI